MPLLQPKRQSKAAAEPFITFNPNPGLSLEGYYNRQMQRFPHMMEALGKK